MALTDFDFQRYIQQTTGKSSGTPQAGRFGVYAFSRDRRVRGSLERTRIVGHALDMTARLERDYFEEELLDNASAASGAIELAEVAARKLGAARPSVHTIEDLPDRASVLIRIDGRDHVLLTERLVSRLSDAGMLFVLGRHVGEIQNGHAPFVTCDFALQHFAAAFYGVVVKPARMAIDAWKRLGAVTADRAGLLACGDLAAARRALVRIEAIAADLADSEVDVAELLSDLEDAGDGDPPDHPLIDASPHLPGRLRALAAFSRSELFRNSVGKSDGETLNAVDTEVEGIVKAW